MKRKKNPLGVDEKSLTSRRKLPFPGPIIKELLTDPSVSGGFLPNLSSFSVTL